MTDREHRAPPGLKAKGKAYWSQVAAEYELNMDELVILDQTARVMDELAEFDRVLAADGLVVVGSQGQPRPHPLVAQRRASRRLLAQLVAQLALPDPEGATVATGAQARSRAGHKARWGPARDELSRRRASA